MSEQNSSCVVKRNINGVILKLTRRRRHRPAFLYRRAWYDLRILVTGNQETGTANDPQVMSAFCGGIAFSVIIDADDYRIWLIQAHRLMLIILMQMTNMLPTTRIYQITTGWCVTDVIEKGYRLTGTELRSQLYQR